MRDVEQRDHNRKSADNLSEILQVVKIHLSQLVVGQALRLPHQKPATDAVALQFQLALVLGGVEMA